MLVEIGSSRRLVGLLLAACGVSLACVWAVPLALPWRAMLTVLLGLGLWRDLERHAGRRSAISALRLRDDGACAVCRAGEWREAVPLASTFVAPYLTVLHLRLAGQWPACAVVILPDALDADDFRRLRVWLRWKGARDNA